MPTALAFGSLAPTSPATAGAGFAKPGLQPGGLRRDRHFMRKRASIIRLQQIGGIPETHPEASNTNALAAHPSDVTKAYCCGSAEHGRHPKIVPIPDNMPSKASAVGSSSNFSPIDEERRGRRILSCS